MSGGSAGFRWLRRNVAYAGVLGAVVALVLAAASLWGPLAGLEPRLAGVAGLAGGAAAFMAWYSVSMLRGGVVRGWTRWELAEAAVSYFIVLLSLWVGFYNALGGWGG